MNEKVTCIICKSNTVENKTYNFHVYSTIKSILYFYIKKIIVRIILLSSKFLKYVKNSLPKKVKWIITTPFRGEVILCTNCGHATMKSPPSIDEIKNYYRFTYWNDRQTNSHEILKEEYLSDLRAEYQVRFVLDNITTKEPFKILEIGGGPCLFSLLLRYQVEKLSSLSLNVCEPGEQWNAHYKFHGINKVADFYPFPVQEKYNYIHTSHWLEHVLDLDDTINYLKEHLENGGFLFIEVPNCGFDYWNLPINDTPHIHFFTPNSLSICFENKGFKLIKMETAGTSIEDWVIEKKINKEDYGFKENGVWIRSIFRLP